jgi:hypothetical protein
MAQNNIQKIYTYFKQKVNKSPRFVFHHKIFGNNPKNTGFISKPMEMMVWWMSKEGKDYIQTQVKTSPAKLLHFLIVTGGGFKFRNASKNPANSLEEFIYKMACKWVSREDHSLITQKYSFSNAPKKHEEKIYHYLAPNKNTFNILTKETLEKLIKDYDAKDKKGNKISENNVPEEKVLEIVNNFSDTPKIFLDFWSNNYTYNWDEKLKKGEADYYTTNDFFLLAYHMLLSPRLTQHAKMKPYTALNEEWFASNPDMEHAHNYVQFWFPLKSSGMGDGKKAIRMSPYLQQKIMAHKSIKNIIHTTAALTFFRMANFWGQSLSLHDLLNPTQTVKLFKMIDAQWETNWIDNTHNYLRMHRILTFLRNIDAKKEHEILTKYLQKIVGEKGYTPSSLKHSHDNFWNHVYFKETPQ